MQANRPRHLNIAPDGVGFHTMRAMVEKCSIQVARKLVDGVTAYVASVQMIVDFKLLVQIQLLVGKLQQVFKIACTHSTSDGRPPYVDQVLLPASRRHFVHPFIQSF
jgi:hypothetical protein